LTCFLLY